MRSAPPPASPRLPPRIRRLSARFERDYQACAATGSRILTDAAEVEARNGAYLAAYRDTVGEPAILRRARLLEEFARQALVRLDPDDLLAGSQKSCAFGFPPSVEHELARLGYAHNPGHIIHDYAGLLRYGVSGLREQIRARNTAAASPAEHTHLAAFGRATAAFACFIERHAGAVDLMLPHLAGRACSGWRHRATDLHLLAEHPPQHFRQALQLVWLAQIFLHAENPAAAISFGRLDQALWPFLRQDLAAGAVTQPEARQLLMAFFLRCCEGEESQNLTVGGVTADGRDATNPLSIAFLDVMRELRTVQPSLSVRLHPDSPPELGLAACELAATGTGQPGFINDQAAVPGLVAAGIPLDRARDFGIVGCYEACPQGDCYPNTVAAGLSLPAVLVHYVRTEAANSAPTFAAFLDGWYQATAAAYADELATRAQPAWNHWRDHAPSPFGSVLLRGCLDSATPLEAGGGRFNLLGVNMLGLGTTVDGLHAVREAVFRHRACSVADLSDALGRDLPDDRLRLYLRNLPGRFGTDSADTNALAAEVSETLARMVLDSRLADGVRPYPALFRFTADIRDHAYATPDGRRSTETLSYGAGPASVVPTSPTAVLQSARHVAHRLCACGAPLALSLPRQDVAGRAGAARLLALVRGYFADGGFHLHVNLASPAELRRALADPTRHAGLTVRISGLSARFVNLPADIQHALIERAEHGL